MKQRTTFAGQFVEASAPGLPYSSAGYRQLVEVVPIHREIHRMVLVKRHKFVPRLS